MAKSGRIPVPIRRRVQRFNRFVLPPVGFVVTLLVTLWLWKHEDRRGQLPGEVEALQVQLTAPAAGVLSTLPQGPWSLFDVVASGQVVARLDDGPVQAALATLDSQRGELETQITAAEHQYLLGERALQQDRQQDVIRLMLELERLRLDVLDRMTQIAVDKVDLQKQNMLVELIERIRDTDVIPQVELIEARRLRDIVQERVRQMTVSLEESTDQVQRARKRLSSLPTIDVPELDRLLAPLRAAVTVQEARIHELELQVDGLTVRAPLSGIVLEVLRHPGQSVQPGEPILVLAAGYGRYIVSFVRQEMDWRPAEGESVTIRERRPGGRICQTVVRRVGPQVMPVPEHQLLAQGSPEWGLPIQLSLPDEFDLVPGELVDVVVRRSGTKPEVE